MTSLVESMKRLFEAGLITEEDLDRSVIKGSITEDDKTYIMQGATPTEGASKAFYDVVWEGDPATSEEEYRQQGNIVVYRAAMVDKVTVGIASGADNVQPEAGILHGKYPEWVADNGLQKKGTYVDYEGQTYYTATDIQRFAHYSPTAATNNYWICPVPDERGVFPYVVGMSARQGMYESYNGLLYKCIESSGAPFKQMYSPDQIPALFVKVEEVS